MSYMNIAHDGPTFMKLWK